MAHSCDHEYCAFVYSFPRSIKQHNRSDIPEIVVLSCCFRQINLSQEVRTNTQMFTLSVFKKWIHILQNNHQVTLPSGADRKVIQIH